jgi:hypothetical protein
VPPRRSGNARSDRVQEGGTKQRHKTVAPSNFALDLVGQRKIEQRSFEIELDRALAARRQNSRTNMLAVQETARRDQRGGYLSPAIRASRSLGSCSLLLFRSFAR